jgi:hypothetical protein
MKMASRHDGMVSWSLHDETASRVRDHRSSHVGAACLWCKHNAAKRNMSRLAALCINAGHSNPQQGFVCRGRAKVRCHSALIWELNLGTRFRPGEPWTVGRSIVGPLTLQNVPPATRGKMLSHSLQAFSVVAALSPLLKERVDDHRQVKADEKSPHDGLRAFVDRSWARLAPVLINSRHRQHSLQNRAEANQYHEQLQQICKPAVGGKLIDGPKADCADDDNGQNRD